MLITLSNKHQVDVVCCHSGCHTPARDGGIPIERGTRRTTREIRQGRIPMDRMRGSELEDNRPQSNLAQRLHYDVHSERKTFLTDMRTAVEAK
jgi:hypothetical protein